MKHDYVSIVTTLESNIGLPISGTASDVGGIVSATSCRKTVKDNRIVTPTQHTTCSQRNSTHYSLLLVYHQRHRETDRRTTSTCDRKTALCTIKRQPDYKIAAK